MFSQVNECVYRGACHFVRLFIALLVEIETMSTTTAAAPPHLIERQRMAH